MDEYLVNGRPTPFATLVEAARRRGEIAIGYRDKTRSSDAAAGYGVRVNIPKSELITPGEGDRVVVLAEQ